MEPPCPRVDHPGNVRWRLPRGGGLWSSGLTCPGAGGTGEGPGARRRLLFLAVMPPCPPQTSLGSCQGASPTRGGADQAVVRHQRAQGGVGRAGRPFRARTWAPTFIFGCCASIPPPDYRGDRMKLWFVTNGPQGAWEGPGAMSGSVAHMSPLKKIAKCENFLSSNLTIKMRKFLHFR